MDQAVCECDVNRPPPRLPVTFANMNRSNLRWVIVVLLYAITWIGGSNSHRHNLKVDAQRMYNDAEEQELEQATWYNQDGMGQPRRITRDGGPISKVDWCFPLLPGVLIADSYYIVGPLYGRGGISIVIYYGFGSAQIGPIAGWVS